MQVLCEAYKRGLTWPKYAWILHSYRLDDLLQSSTSNEGSCRVQRILEGIFIFQLTKEDSRFTLETSSTCHNFSNSIGCNSYAYLLHDSVWALISSVDTDSNEAPTLFHSKSDSSKVYFYHNLNSMADLIGIYDGTSRTLTNKSEIMFLDYDLPIVNKQLVLVPYLLPLPILSFIFNTILLILYIVFRNEPSIKSTSVSLSMLILIGCYVLIVYATCLVVDKLYQLDLCMAFVWLGGAGLSAPLILATILVKMLRVYRIFTVLKPLKRSGHLSDFALLVYTLLILSPNIIVLILWTAIDPRYRVSNIIEHPGYIENRVTCHRSKYELAWFALTISYVFLLSFAVIVVAVKSRKIRLAQFKDTKKVNLFIFSFNIVGICTFSYWQLLLDSGFVIPSLITIYTGHLLASFLCQIILFVPKIWVAIKETCKLC